MAKKEKEYQRLPGRRRTLTGTCTLWLGPDHLLRVDSHGYAENYKRFYYRDIQSIVLVPTPRRQSFLTGWAALGAPLATLALFLGGAWGISLGSLAGLAALMLAVTWLRGPTCECRLQTAVQTEVLPSLNLVRAASKALKRLLTRVEAVQGKLGPEFFLLETTAGTDTSDLFHSSPAQESVPGAVQPGPQQGERLVRHSSGTSHAVLFSLLLLDAATTAIDIAVNHLALTLAGVVIYLALTAAVIVALIQQSRTDIGRFLRWQVLACLGYVCTSFLLSSAYNIASGLTVSLKNGRRVDSQWDMLVALSETSAWDSPWLMGLSVFSVAASLTIAVPGWVGLVRFWAHAAPRSSSEPLDSSIRI
jgi:hypothetical protein